jgi:uncharacterized protein
MRARSLSTLLAVLAFSLAGPSLAQPGARGEEVVGAAAKAGRLAGESSPYLLSHAGDPVDWHPWGREAFARARAEGKPVFLSIGYSSCHWCHVMAREVFSDPETAALLNRWFVNVLVDREERPDVDEVYVTAVQLLTGSAGWPASVFLTPEGKPFYGGGYFPKEARGGRPGFATLLRRLHEGWSDRPEGRRAEMEAVARRLTADVEEVLAGASEESADAVREPPSATDARNELARWKAMFDPEHGGFARPPAWRPKFPSHAALLLLLESWDRGDEEAGRMLSETLRAMGRGAIHDRLAGARGGGFHRYAVDREWRVPHFEKMLYDNALLAELCAAVVARTGDPELARLGRETLDFLLVSMALEPGSGTGGFAARHAQGGFAASLDADAAYYTWTRGEVAAAVGEVGLATLVPLLGLDGEAEEGADRHTLHLAAGASPETLAAAAPLLAKLAEARERRPAPRRDDTVLADWNGLAVAALARGAEAFGEPRYRRAAEETAAFLLERLRPTGGGEGPLLHTPAGPPAQLDDHAFLIRGLLALDASAAEGGDRRLLAAARELADEMEARLAAPGGGWFRAAADPYLPLQARTVTGSALPPGNAVAIVALLDLAARLGDPAGAEYRTLAERALSAFAGDLGRFPGAVPGLAWAVLRFHAEDPAPPATGGEPGLFMNARRESRKCAISPREPEGMATAVDERPRRTCSTLRERRARTAREGVQLWLVAGWLMNSPGWR